MITKNLKIKKEMALPTKRKTTIDLEKFKSSLTELDYYDNDRVNTLLFYYIINNTNYVDNINIVISRFFKFKEKINNKNLFDNLPVFINKFVSTLRKSNEYLENLKNEVASIYQNFWDIYYKNNNISDFYGSFYEHNLRLLRNCLRNKIISFDIILFRNFLAISSESSFCSTCSKDVLNSSFYDKQEFLNFLDIIKKDNSRMNILYGTDDIIEKEQKSYFDYYNLTGFHSFSYIPFNFYQYRFWVEMNWFHERDEGFLTITFAGPFPD